MIGIQVGWTVTVQMAGAVLLFFDSQQVLVSLLCREGKTAAFLLHRMVE
jgi:hypothetical protein